MADALRAVNEGVTDSQLNSACRLIPGSYPIQDDRMRACCFNLASRDGFFACSFPVHNPQMITWILVYPLWIVNSAGKNKCFNIVWLPAPDIVVRLGFWQEHHPGVILWLVWYLLNRSALISWNILNLSQLGVGLRYWQERANFQCSEIVAVFYPYLSMIIKIKIIRIFPISDRIMSCLGDSSEYQYNGWI